ncbi:hypothetical protein [uncultured Tenacibaculum sp.]|uniref:hypothetical protein n=1 Tax=uncultured Tenacibaculum sp. TaxID=174713 RepID=UPI00261920A2|nr:hypothetical protein [uncultured Tenacibaculum sp.]
MDNIKLLGLSKKIETILDEYGVSNFKVKEMKLQAKNYDVEQHDEGNSCKIVWDPETDELIWKCD